MTQARSVALTVPIGLTTWHGAYAAVLVMTGVVLLTPGFGRLVLAASVAGVLVAAAVAAPRHVVLALVPALALLGLARRLVTGIEAPTSAGDPLVLAGAAALLTLTAVALSRGAARERTMLASAVLAFSVLGAASIANPLQGGLRVGLGGALLVLVPMCAFWIGRALMDADLFRQVLVVWRWTAVAVALYGLHQVFVGFPSWDAHWIDHYGYTALNVNGVIRPFSTFASSAEYSLFVAIGLMAWVWTPRTSASRALSLPAVVLLAFALFLIGTRGVIVLSVAALGLTVAARLGWSGIGAAVVGVAVLVSIPSVTSRLISSPSNDSAAGTLVAHQITGLTDPFGERSTLPGHIDRLIDGIRQAAQRPAGLGVGSVTTAAGKYDGRNAGTEVDPSNAAVALGVPGLVLYLVMAVASLALAYRRARRGDYLALAATAVLVVTGLNWLNGGHYSVTWLPWLAIGWLDSQQRALGAPDGSRPVEYALRAQPVAASGPRGSEG